MIPLHSRAGQVGQKAEGLFNALEYPCGHHKAQGPPLVAANGVKKETMVSIHISTTRDITAYYPAAALRLSGYDDVPLFSSAEPDIVGGLPLCIRFLVTVDGKKPNRVTHIYHNRAKALRPDLALSAEER